MRGQPERILVVIPSPVFGGAEAQTLQVARGLGRMGAQVAVVAEPALLVAADAALGAALALPAALLPPEGLSPGPAIRWQARGLAPLLETWRPDASLVCCALPTEGLGALAELAKARVPALAVAHLVRQDWKLAEAERAALTTLPTRWATVSDASARRLEALMELRPGQVAAIPNGLPAMPPLRPDRASLGLPDDIPLLLQVGRLDIRKGAQLAPAIAIAIAPARMILAGEGPLMAHLAGAVGISLPGQTARVRELLAVSDAFLLPSDHEGCPLSILEAAQAGCPILATRQALEAWPEAEEMARIVPRDPDRIAAVFAECLADAAGTAARVSRARAVAAAWDEAAMIRRTAWLLAEAGVPWR